MSKKKNESWHKKRHSFIFNFFRFPMRLSCRAKEKFIANNFDGVINGPAIVLCNHITGYDPIKIGVSFRETLYFVATDDLFNKKFIGKLLKWSLNPIPKSKSVADVRCIRSMFKVLKDGYKVVVFPEGNRTYSGELCTIDKSIAKLCKSANVPLILLNFEGGYLSDPRWAKKRGRAENHLVLRKVLSTEELKSLSNDELYEIIVENLKTKNKGFNDNHVRRRAEYMERLFYYCPNCHKMESIVSRNTRVSCLECGFELEYNKDTTFTLINGEKEIKDIKEWYDIQDDMVRKFDPFKNDDIIFEDFDCKLFQVVSLRRKKLLVKKGHLTMTNKEIKIENNKSTIKINLDDIIQSCALMKNKATFYFKDYNYQLRGRVRFNAFKYVEMYHHIKNIKNGENNENEFLGI